MLKKSEKKNEKRIFLLDYIRGISIICMVVFHGFITMQMFERFEPAGTTLYNFFAPASPFFASLFILICGLCCFLSKSNLKRGLIMLGVAVLLTVATYFIDKYIAEGTLILFGIIHFLAVSVLLFCVLKPIIKIIPSWLGVIINLILFFLLYNIEKGYIGISGIFTINLPESWYSHYYLFPLGFFTKDFYSADYYPLLPWIFMFFAGAFIGKTVTSKTLPKFCYKNFCPPLGFAGRHTLIVYILHQPVIFGLLYVIDLIISLF